MTTLWLVLGIGPPLLAVGSLFAVNVAMPYVRRFARRRRRRIG